VLSLADDVPTPADSVSNGRRAFRQAAEKNRLAACAPQNGCFDFLSCQASGIFRTILSNKPDLAEADFTWIAFCFFQSGSHKINPPGKENESLANMKTTTPPVRNPINHSSRDSRWVPRLLVLLGLGCFALLPGAQATEPDTVLPNGNTAEGSGVLVSLTTGIWNSGFGFQALNHDTAGKDNTATGVRALFSNISGNNNTANGVYALYSNTTGWYNNATGAYALANNTNGNSNTANGYGALYYNKGDYNTATGFAALYHDTTGNSNTASGYQALFSNTVGVNNTAVGYQALFANQWPDPGYGTDNTACGFQALHDNTKGYYNTAYGVQALYYNTLGNNNTACGVYALLQNMSSDNTAFGFEALRFNTAGDLNTGTGIRALYANTIGHNNTAVGYAALGANTTGSFNTALGQAAGHNITTGSNNIDIGNQGSSDDSGTIRIGDVLHSATYIAGIAGQTVGGGGSTCYVDNAGKLGVFLSARRFKTDIADMGAVSDALLALRPVTFHYKPELDKTGIPQFGLVAEEVAEVNPDLVTHDPKGDISTVRYEAVNAMLLNEFLKEHRKVEEQERKMSEQSRKAQEQEATIAELKASMGQQQKGIDVLTAQLKEQAAQIQKVSARLTTASPSRGGLEVSNPAPKTVSQP